MENRRGRRSFQWWEIQAIWGLKVLACTRCGWDRDETDLEKAHVINFAECGVDGPWNILPLCWLCHKDCPVWLPGEEWWALQWFGLCEPSVKAVSEWYRPLSMERWLIDKMDEWATWDDLSHETADAIWLESA